MTRVILFRAWDKKEKKMLPPFGLEDVRDTFRFTKSEGFALQYDPIFEKRDVEIMQFTGLLDKNGTEIYEGDIVKAAFPNGSEFSGAVHWTDWARWGWGHMGAMIEGNSYFVNDHDGETIYEVIGNIYEHPDLVKEASK